MSYANYIMAIKYGVSITPEDSSSGTHWVIREYTTPNTTGHNWYIPTKTTKA